MRRSPHSSVKEARGLLVFAPEAPAFDRNGGALRFYTMLEMLSRLFPITFIATNVSWREIAPGLDPYGDALRSLGINVYLGDIPFRRLLRSGTWVAALFEFYRSALSRYFDAIHIFAPRLPVIIDSVDLHYVRELRMIEYEPHLKTLSEAMETKASELGTYRRADMVITVTEHDKEILLRELPDLNVAVVPNIHKALPNPPGTHRPARFALLFVGGFTHRPNVDAVVFFCREILPLIRLELPQVSVTIVGAQPPAEVIALASASKVTVTGYVKDLSPYLSSASVSIAPLRYGSGMKGKITEAMAAGLPVVTTSIGAEGLDLQHRSNALIADTPRDFARAVIELCCNDELHRTLSENGLYHFKRRFDISIIEPSLAKIISSLQHVKPKGLSFEDRVKFYQKVAGQKVRRVVSALTSS
jgi:O-antigen biosynthesis protein